MKWGLQHVKVTLEERDSGETVVIEQSSDGRVTCERGSTGKRTEAVSKSARPPGPPKATPPAEKHEKPKVERKHERDDGPRPKAAAKPPAESAAGSRKQTGAKKNRARDQRVDRKTDDTGPLRWEPVKDHEYDGFAANSRAGQFKVLITKGSLWALFYEEKPAHPKNLGCFLRSELEEAKKHAQALHDSGWPESKSGPITPARIIHMCPAPPEAEGEGVAEARGKAMTEAEKHPMPKKTPTDTSKPPPPAPEPSKARKGEADRDNELLTSFAKAVDTALDDDEDD